MSLQLCPINTDESNHFQPCRYWQGVKMRLTHPEVIRRRGREGRDWWKPMIVMNGSQDPGTAEDQEVRRAPLAWWIDRLFRREPTHHQLGNLCVLSAERKMPQNIPAVDDLLLWLLSAYTPSAAWQSHAVSVQPLAGRPDTLLLLLLLCDLHLIKLSGARLPEEELEKRNIGSFAIM